MSDTDQRTSKTLSLAEITSRVNASADGKEPIAPAYDCTHCNDLGLIAYDVPVGHPHHGKLVPCSRCEKGREMQRTILSRKFEQVHLPRHYIDARLRNWFDNLTAEQRKGKYLAYCFTLSFAEHGGQASAHDAIDLFSEANAVHQIVKQLPASLVGQRQQADKVRFGLVLQGAVGIGKTWLMAAALNAMRDTHHVTFAKCSDLLEEIISTWGTSEKQSDALDPYRHTEILFLDDVHMDTTNKVSTYYREIMTTLIRHRYDHQMPTMITTNADKNTFYEAWGKRVADAVLDMCHWVPMGGDKLRDTTQDWSAL